MKRIDILLVALSFLFVCACGGGGGGGSQTALTPSDLGWIIPETDPNNITTLPGGEEISSELISIRRRHFELCPLAGAPGFRSSED